MSRICKISIPCILLLIMTFIVCPIEAVFSAGPDNQPMQLARVSCMSGGTGGSGGGSTGTCGNGVIEAGEECEPAPLNLDGKTCLDFKSHIAAGLSCTSDCKLDPSGCIVAECGNGQLEFGEECDGEEFSPFTKTCIDKGYNDGWLHCTEDCKIEEECCNFITIPEDCCGMVDCYWLAADKVLCDAIQDRFGACSWAEDIKRCTGFFDCGLLENGGGECGGSTYLGEINEPGYYRYLGLSTEIFCGNQPEVQACCDPTIQHSPFSDPTHGWRWIEYRFADGKCWSQIDFPDPHLSCCPDGYFYNTMDDRLGPYLDIRDGSGQCEQSVHPGTGWEAEVCTYHLAFQKCYYVVEDD